MSNYPYGYHARRAAEAYGQYVTYSTWAALDARNSRREDYDLATRSAFQRLAAQDYGFARRAQAVYETQTRLAQEEREANAR
jgi:hypothetical protein